MKFLAPLLLSALVLASPVFTPGLPAQVPVPLTILRQFDASDAPRTTQEGNGSRGRLLQGRDGNFYGTTTGGGANDTGTVVRLTPDGVTTILGSFDAPGSRGTNGHGARPDAGLIPGRDGGFYGTTTRGGANGTGTVFRITLDGVMTTLHSFDADYRQPARRDRGDAPCATLLEGSDGNFYGTTSRGGADTVFRLTRDGVYTLLHAFNGGDGARPAASLIEGSDGDFYGTTSRGGANDAGTIFRMTPAGVLTTLHSFGNANADGAQPFASLVQDRGGDLFGTTSAGGAGGTGTVFRLTRAGVFSTLHQFSALEGRGVNDGGASPRAGLLPAGDGIFYGVTAAGGPAGVGTVFQIIRAGVLTTLHGFSVTDGAGPETGLTRGRDGRIYGTTASGGANGQGTFFRLDAVSPAGADGTGLRLTLRPGVGYVDGPQTAEAWAAWQAASLFPPVQPGRPPITSDAAVSTWLGGTGLWSDGSFWNGGVPDSANANVFIDGDKTGVNSAVTLDSTRTVGALTLDKGDTLTIADGTNLFFINSAGFAGSGTLTLNGTLNLGNNTSGSDDSLRFYGSLTMTGTGTFNLIRPNTLLLAANDGGLLTINQGLTIQGQGDFGHALTTIVNNALITANQNGSILYLNPGGYGLTNGSTGAARAEQGGILELYTSGNYYGGTFTAFTGSQIKIDVTGVVGATLATQGTGAINVGDGATFYNVTNTGAVTVLDGGSLYLATTFLNNGAVTVGSTLTGGDTGVRITNPTTLSGSGTINLIKPGSFIQTTHDGDLLTVGQGTTIQGVGNVGNGVTSFLNNGLITANQSGGTLLIDLLQFSYSPQYTFTNGATGVVRAENGGRLELATGGSYTGGTFSALDGSQIEINQTYMISATLATQGTGMINVGNDASFYNVTNNGAATVLDGAALNLNAAFTNNGSLTLGTAGSNADVLIRYINPTAISGTGTITLTKPGAYVTSSHDGDRLTINQGVTIQGTGSLGRAVSAFTNNGLITANQNGGTLYLAPGVNFDFTTATTGAAQAENGGVLELTPGIYNGGTFTAQTGSQIYVQHAAKLTGATVATAGSGVVYLRDQAAFTNVTNTGAATILDGGSLYLATALVNNGTLTVGSTTTGGDALIRITNPTTLSGTGTINLIKPNSVIQTTHDGDRLTIGRGVTIQGTGDVGHGLTTFTNYGLITANGQGNTLTILPGGGTSDFLNATTSVTDPVTQATTSYPGTVEARDGGTVRFNTGLLDNQGLLQAVNATAGNSSLSMVTVILKNLANGVLTGGTYVAAATGTAGGTATLSFDGNGEIKTNAANVTINGVNAAFPDFSGLLDNQGSFSLLGQRSFNTAGSLKDEGTLTIDAGSTLHISGDLTDANTSVLSVVIGGALTQGAQSPGVIQINGKAAIAGTLALSFSPGAALPKATDVLAIGSVAATLSGGFANVSNGQRLNTTDALGSCEVDYGPDAANPHLILLTNFGPVGPLSPPVVNSALSVKGTVGVPFSYQITATYVPSDFVAVPLPAGLTLDRHTGIISGTPTASGTTTVALTVHNGAGNGAATLTIVIADSAPVITSALTASGTVGTAFTYQITARYNPTSFDAQRLPPGLTLNKTTGTLSGTPTKAGVFTSTITATNNVGPTVATLTITIVDPAPTLGGSPPGGTGGKLSAQGRVGTAFSFQLAATGNPTSYSATGLPAGLNFDTATGLTSGTPTVAGTFSVAVTATNASGTAGATLTLVIASNNPPPPVVTVPAGGVLTASGQVAVAFSYQIVATNNPTSYAASGLPAGLAIAPATGVISGTPTQAGTFNATVSATNAGGTGSANLTITVAVARRSSPAPRRPAPQWAVPSPTRSRPPTTRRASTRADFRPA